MIDIRIKKGIQPEFLNLKNLGNELNALKILEHYDIKIC